jgi:hypothetical protein
MEQNEKAIKHVNERLFYYILTNYKKITMLTKMGKPQTKFINT